MAVATTFPPLYLAEAALLPQDEFTSHPPIRLARPVSFVGSGEPNHVRLRSRTVSRVHAVVLNTDGRVLIRDLASRTHVIVNDQPVREASLKDGDRIKIGRANFVYSAGQTPEVVAGDELGAVPAQLYVVGSAADAVPIVGPVFLIGGRPGADLLAAGQGVAHAHAIVVELAGRRFLYDLASGNPTRVNGRLARRVELADGDVIEIGAMQIRYADRIAAAAEPEIVAMAAVVAESVAETVALPEPVAAQAPAPVLEVTATVAAAPMPEPAVESLAPMEVSKPEVITAPEAVAAAEVISTLEKSEETAASEEIEAVPAQVEPESEPEIAVDTIPAQEPEATILPDDELDQAPVAALIAEAEVAMEGIAPVPLDLVEAPALMPEIVPPPPQPGTTAQESLPSEPQADEDVSVEGEIASADAAPSLVMQPQPQRAEMPIVSESPVRAKVPSINPPASKPAQPIDPAERFKGLGPLVLAVASTPSSFAPPAAEEKGKTGMILWLLFGLVILGAAAAAGWLWWKGMLF